MRAIKKIIFSVVLFVYVFMPCCLWAQDIYVDNTLTNNITDGRYSIANRDNSGSDGSAYMSLKEAINAMKGGDIIYLRGGIYYESGIYIDPLTKSGTADLPSMLKSYPGEWAVLDGEWNCSAACRGIICQYPTGQLEHWVFENLEIMRGGLIPETDTNRGSPSGIHFYQTKNITIRNCYIHDCQGYYGQNPAGVAANVPEEMAIEYNYFENNACEGNGNCANIVFFSDYRDMNKDPFNPDFATRKNEIKYNLLKGSGVGVKYKDEQIFGALDRDPDALTYSTWGDKVHHNIIINATNRPIYGGQDFLQVYNNIIINAPNAENEQSHEGIVTHNDNSPWKPIQTCVYNNLIVRGYLYYGDYGQNIVPYLFMSNNIVAEDRGYEFRPLSFSRYNPGGIIDMSHAVVERNYIYDSKPYYSQPIYDVVFSQNVTGGGHYYISDFDSKYGYTNYKNFYDSNNELYQGVSEEEQYKTRKEHIIEGVITIGNGGIGGAHPYLVDIIIPSYIGAANPDDDRWVSGVLSLATTDVLKTLGPEDPLWIEGSSLGVKGDLNSDGKIDILDIQLCVNVILGIEMAEPYVGKAKQIVEPVEECDVLDVQAIVNIILGKL